MTFVRFCFNQVSSGLQFVDSPHLAVIAAKLEECAAGKCKRLIICLPPRSLKSIITSVAFPAWVLGKWPHKNIICASYGQFLADRHARDTRTVMMSEGYKAAFEMRLASDNRAIGNFTTKEGGGRMATSVGGALTGLGADIIIVDDPLKPEQAYSESGRNAANDWFDRSLLSRLNNKQDGVIIVVMQRLHQDDLVGHLLEQGSWELLSLPAIADVDESFVVESRLKRVSFSRRVGDVLDPRRETRETLESMRISMSSLAFEAPYQQNPQPEGGAMIKRHWLCRYTPEDLPRRFDYKVQSWDTASKPGEFNDYSVCTTWGVINRFYYLLDVYRQRLDFPGLVQALQGQYENHRPSRIIIEDHGSGTQLLQFARKSGLPLTPYLTRGVDKLMRVFAQEGVFESGKVFLPSSAPWLDEYVMELTGFPGTKHDDQVDSTMQALDHLETNSRSKCSIRELII